MQHCAQADPKGSKRLWSEPLQAKLQQQAPPDAAVRLLNVAATAPHPDNYLPPQAVVLAQTSLYSPEADEDEVNTEPPIPVQGCRNCKPSGALQALPLCTVHHLRCRHAGKPCLVQPSFSLLGSKARQWLATGVRGPAHAPSEPWGRQTGAVSPLA